MPENIKLQKDFLYVKLNSDMSPEATDKFIPIILKELAKFKEKEDEKLETAN